MVGVRRFWMGAGPGNCHDGNLGFAGAHTLVVVFSGFGDAEVMATEEAVKLPSCRLLPISVVMGRKQDPFLIGVGAALSCLIISRLMMQLLTGKAREDVEPVRKACLITMFGETTSAWTDRW